MPSASIPLTCPELHELFDRPGRSWTWFGNVTTRLQRAWSRITRSMLWSESTTTLDGEHH